jgi:hypothetical protein
MTGPPQNYLGRDERMRAVFLQEAARELRYLKEVRDEGKRRDVPGLQAADHPLVSPPVASHPPQQS